jgi:hypothetical protein
MVFLSMTNQQLAVICKDFCPWLTDVETQTEPNEGKYLYLNCLVGFTLGLNDNRA